MIYNKKNYWYKKENNDILSASFGTKQNLKKYAKGFGSSVYNYTDNLSNIYPNINYNYRFNIVPKIDISLFGNVYLKDTIYNIAKTIKPETILASTELRTAIRNGDVVCMDASMDNLSLGDILLDTVTYKENLFSNKLFDKVLITISNIENFNSVLTMHTNYSDSYYKDGIPTTGDIIIGSGVNSYGITNMVNVPLLETVKDITTGTEQYLIFYKNIKDNNVSTNIFFDLLSSSSLENYIKIELIYDDVVVLSNDSTHFEYNNTPIYTNYTTRFSSDNLCLFLSDSQMYISKNIPLQHDLDSLMINTDYLITTYHLPLLDITEYSYINENFDNSVFSVNTNITYTQSNNFVSDDLINKEFDNYHNTDYYVSEFTLSDPLIVDNAVMVDGNTILIQNSGLYEYRNKNIYELITDYTKFKTYIKYGNYAGKSFNIDTDNNGEGLVNSKVFVESHNYLIRNKSEYTLSKDLNFNETVSFNIVKTSLLNDSDYMKHIISNIAGFYRLSGDNLNIEYVVDNKTVSTLHLPGVANKKIFQHIYGLNFGLVYEEYVVVDSSLYEIDNTDVYNMKHVLVYDFASDSSGELVDISYNDVFLYLYFENKMVKFNLTTKTVVPCEYTFKSGMFVIEITDAGMFSADYNNVYFNNKIAYQSKGILEMYAYNETFQIKNIYGEYLSYIKGSDFLSIDMTPESYVFHTDDKYVYDKFSITDENKLEIVSDDNNIYLDGISNFITLKNTNITNLDLKFECKLSEIKDNTELFYLGDKRKTINNVDVLPSSYVKLNIRSSVFGNKVVLSYRNGNDIYDLTTSSILVIDTNYEIGIKITKSTIKYLFELTITDTTQNAEATYNGDFIITENIDIINNIAEIGKSETSNIFSKGYISIPKPNYDYEIDSVSNQFLISVFKNPQKLMGYGDFCYIIDEIEGVETYSYDISKDDNYGIYDGVPSIRISNSVTYDISTLMNYDFPFVETDTYVLKIGYITDANDQNGLSKSAITITDQTTLSTTKYELESSETYKEIPSYDITNKNFVLTNKQIQTVFNITSIEIVYTRNVPYYNVYKTNILSNNYVSIYKTRTFRDVFVENNNNTYILESDRLANIDTTTMITAFTALNDVYDGVVVGTGISLYKATGGIYNVSGTLILDTIDIGKIGISGSDIFVENSTAKYIIKGLNTQYNVLGVPQITGYDHSFGIDAINVSGANNDIRLYSYDSVSLKYIKHRGIDSDILYSSETTDPVFVTTDNDDVVLFLDMEIVVIRKNDSYRTNYEKSNLVIPNSVKNVDYAYIDGGYVIYHGIDDTDGETKYFVTQIPDFTDMYFSNTTSSYKVNDATRVYVGDNTIFFDGDEMKKNVYRDSLISASYVPYTYSSFDYFDYKLSKYIFVCGRNGIVLKYDSDTSVFTVPNLSVPVYSDLLKIVSTGDKTVFVGRNGVIGYSLDNENFVVIQDDKSLDYTSVIIDDISGDVYVTTNYGGIRKYNLKTDLVYIKTLSFSDNTKTRFSDIILYKNKFICISDTKIFVTTDFSSYDMFVIDKQITKAKMVVVSDDNMTSEPFDVLYLIVDNKLYSLDINDISASIQIVGNYVNKLNSFATGDGSLFVCGDGLYTESGDKIDAVESISKLIFTDYNLARKSYILEKDKSIKKAKGKIEKPTNNCYYFHENDKLVFSDYNTNHDLRNFTAYQDFYYLNSRTINTPGSFGEYEDGFKKYDKSITAVSVSEFSKHNIISDDYVVDKDTLTINSGEFTSSVISQCNALHLISSNIINNKFVYVMAIEDDLDFEINDFVVVNNKIYRIQSSLTDFTNNHIIQFIGNDNLNVIEYLGVVEKVIMDFRTPVLEDDYMSVVSLKVLSSVKNKLISEGDKLNLEIYLADISLTIEAESEVVISGELMRVSFDLKTTIIDFEFESMTVQEFSDLFRQYKLLSDYIEYTLSSRDAVYYQQETKVIEHRFETDDFVTPQKSIDVLDIDNNYYILTGSHIHVYDSNKIVTGVYNITGTYRYMCYNPLYNAIYLSGDNMVGIFDIATKTMVFTESLLCDNCIYYNNFVYINDNANNSKYRYEYKTKTISSKTLIGIYDGVEYLYDSAVSSISTNISYPMFFVLSDTPLKIIDNKIITTTSIIDISVKSETLVTNSVSTDIDGLLCYSDNNTIIYKTHSTYSQHDIVDMVYTDYLYVLTVNDYINVYDNALQLVATYGNTTQTYGLRKIMNETFVIMFGNNFISLVVEIVEPKNATININRLVLDETYVTRTYTPNSFYLNDNFTEDVLSDLNDPDNFIKMRNLNYSTTDMLSMLTSYDKHYLKEAFNMDFSQFGYINFESNVTDYNRYYNLETTVTYNSPYNNTQESISVAYETSLYGMNYTLFRALPSFVSYNFDNINFDHTFSSQLKLNNQFSIYKNTITIGEDVMSGLEMFSGIFFDILDSSSNVIAQVYFSSIEKKQYIGKTTYYYLINTNKDLSSLNNNGDIRILSRSRFDQVSEDLNYSDTNMVDISQKYITNYISNIDLSKYHEMIRNDINIREYASAYIGFDDNILVMDVYDWNSDVCLNYRPVEILEMGYDKILKKAVSVTLSDYIITNNVWFGVSDSGVFNYILKDGLTVQELETNYIWVLNAYIKNAIIGLDNGGIVWYSGEFFEGEFEKGTWYSGDAYNMVFDNGDVFSKKVEYISNLVNIGENDLTKTFFKNVVFKTGTFEGYMYESTFESGVFKNGLFSGDFLSGDFNGHFVAGNFYGNFIGGNFDTSRYDSYFYGTMNGGVFNSGIWKTGVMKNSIFGRNSNKENQAIMEYGYIIDSVIECGDTTNMYTTIYNSIIDGGTVNGGHLRYTNWKNGVMNYGVFDTDNDIIGVEIRQDIVSLDSVYVNIIMKKPHYFKTLSYENDVVPNYITIQGKPRVFNGEVFDSTIALGYNTDVKKHYIVEIVDEYTVVIELDKDFPFGETLYSYVPYKGLSENVVNVSQTNISSGEFYNGDLYIHSDTNMIINDLNILEPSITNIPQGEYVINKKSGDIWSINNILGVLYISKNNVLISQMNGTGYGIVYNEKYNSVLIVSGRYVYIMDSFGVSGIIQHSAVPRICSNIYITDDCVIFDTSAQQQVKYNIGTTSLMKKSITTRTFKKCIGDYAYYIDQNGDGYIYDTVLNVSSNIKNGVSVKSNIYDNGTPLFVDGNNIYELNFVDSSITLVSGGINISYDISGIVRLDDDRYLCSIQNSVIELDKTFTATGIHYDISGVIDIIALPSSMFAYVFTANNIYLLSSKSFEASVSCTDYMLKYQPSIPTVETKPTVVGDNYIGGIRLASRWDAGRFNGGIFNYGYYYSGIFKAGIFRGGVIERCDSFGGNV